MTFMGHSLRANLKDLWVLALRRPSLTSAASCERYGLVDILLLSLGPAYVVWPSICFTVVRAEPFFQIRSENVRL